jgi:DNA-binding SARP family transcriptional activator
VEFRVLGPVQLLADGRPVPLKERKLRLVLALLLLEANQLVPVDRLVDLLWPHDPPSSARRIVQAHLSRLRTTLEGLDRSQAQLARYGECYMLACDPQRVDAHLFRTLLSRARCADDDRTKIEILQRALSLWHGPALADVAADGLRRELCDGLDEARLTAIEDRFEVELRLGGHMAVLDELTDLHARQPSRARAAGQLMMALHRSGRSSEALQVYLRTRRWLRAELGVDPTADLDRLYTAILRGDPALNIPQHSPDVPKPAASPSDPTTAAPRDRPDVPGPESGDVSGDPLSHDPSRTGAAMRLLRPVRPAAESGMDVEVRRQFELIAAQRGVGTQALAQQIIAEWVAAQRRQAAPPDHLNDLMGHLNEARSAATALLRQTEPGSDGDALAA